MEDLSLADELRRTSCVSLVVELWNSWLEVEVRQSTGTILLDCEGGGDTGAGSELAIRLILVS